MVLDSSGFSGRLGYLVPEFPQQTHIFFWRELSAMRAMGLDVALISTKAADSSAIKHSFAEKAAEECFYLHPVSVGALIYLILHPLWLCRCLAYVCSLNDSLRERLKVFYLILVSANLLNHARHSGITHVHGHSCANSAHILSMSQLSNQISYSLTLHGSLGNYGSNHRKKMERAKFVSAVTKPLKEEVIQVSGLPESKVPVISMGVDLEAFTPLNESRSREEINFISVARLARGKGHEYALQALVTMKQKQYKFHYHIVGSGPYQEGIEQQVKDLGLESYVTLHGSLGESAVLKLLLQSDVLLLTSVGNFEAAPVCVMEAMACGVPCIVSYIGGTPDMISQGVDGFLVDQRSVSDIENAMDEFFTNPDKLEDMSKAARVSALEKFDYKKHAKNLVSYITS